MSAKKGAGTARLAVAAAVVLGFVLPAARAQALDYVNCLPQPPARAEAVRVSWTPCTTAADAPRDHEAFLQWAQATHRAALDGSQLTTLSPPGVPRPAQAAGTPCFCGVALQP